MELFLELRAVFTDLPVNGGMIQLHPTFFHEFFDVARTQGIGYVPPDARQDDLLREMGPLETLHRCSPLLVRLNSRGRSYLK
jgi:hypothetical protein